MTKNNHIIIGAGGHGRVIADSLIANGKNILGFIDSDRSKTGSMVLGLSVLGDNSVLERIDTSTTNLVNGIGQIQSNAHRVTAFTKGKELGFEFTTIIHPAAVISQSAHLSEGCQILALSCVSACASIGVNTIINHKALVDHDCNIGDHCHIAINATLAGNVCVGENTFIGAGAIITQGIKIGKNCVVGAGSIVLCDVPDSSKIKGLFK